MSPNTLITISRFNTVIATVGGIDEILPAIHRHQLPKPLMSKLVETLNKDLPFVYACSTLKIEKVN